MLYILTQIQHDAKFDGIKVFGITGESFCSSLGAVDVYVIKT